MAAITMKTVSNNAVQFLDDVTITNQTAASTAVTQAVRVPQWATSVVFYIFYDSSGGTTPKFDFVLNVPDFGDQTAYSVPTDATDVATLGNAAWDGITQVTGAGPYLIAVEVGPNVTDDDTGSATASCYYGVKSTLTPVVGYKYTTQDAADDADYRFRIVAHFRP